MTNRLTYTDYTPPTTKADEIQWLADWLAAMDKPLTSENAQAALRQFRANAPGEWILTEGDVPSLWAEYCRVSLAAEPTA